MTKEIIIVESTYNSASKNKGSNRVFSKADGEIVEIIEIVEDSIPNNHIKGYARLHDKDTITKKYRYTTGGSYYSKNRDSLSIKRTFDIDSSETKHSSLINRAFYLDDELPFKFTNQTIVIREPSIKEQTVLRLYKDLGKPLYVINGKVINPNNISSIEPDEIESLTVLKGKSAIEAYGAQGGNGVLLIKLKDVNSPKIIKSPTETVKGPWKLGRTEVNNLTYIDDEDPSKNATLAYITKYTSDEILDNHKSDLEKFGLKVKISKIKRNKKKEITSIKISVSDENGGKSSASYKDDDGISGVEFGKYEGSLVIRTSTMN